MAKNTIFHGKPKDIDIQYHFFRDMVEDGKVILEKVDTLNDVADELVKLVRLDKFNWCYESMGLISPKN